MSIFGNSIAPAAIESNLVNGEPPQMAIVPPNADRHCDPNKTEDEDDLDNLHCEETMRVEDEMDETEDEDFSTAPESDSVRKPEISNSKILCSLDLPNPTHALSCSHKWLKGNN